MALGGGEITFVRGGTGIVVRTESVVSFFPPKNFFQNGSLFATGIVVGFATDTGAFGGAFPIVREVGASVVGRAGIGEMGEGVETVGRGVVGAAGGEAVGSGTGRAGNGVG